VARPADRGKLMTAIVSPSEAISAQPRVFGDLMRRQKALGQKIAFVDPRREVTFAEFNERVNRLANALQSRGLKPGDRIALLARNSVALVEHIATAKAGLIPVPLNWRLSPTELVNLLNDCTPSALVCDEQGAIVAEQTLLTEIYVPLRIGVDMDRTGWLDHEQLVREGINVEPEAVVVPDDTALLIYTSGTTGDPKAAMISHRGLVENCMASARDAIGVNETDTILCVMPLFHVGGLCYYLLAAFAAGSTSILRPIFDVSDLLRSLEKFAVTNIHLVPTMIADLLADDGAAKAAASLRRIVYAGSAMPIALLERAMQVFRTVKFSQSYGSTEGGIISTLGSEAHDLAASTEENAHLLKSCGKPIGDCDVRLVKDNGAETVSNEPGEVLVRSPRTMIGYWNRSDKTSEAFSGGYLRTGDIGYRDAAGYLYLIDRRNDMIVTGGENVFPSEVEQVLCRHADIAEAAVFGLADARWVERVVAAVVLCPGSKASEQELIAFTKQHLAAYKCPKEIFVLPNLPRTGVGKVSRKLLRNRFRSESVIRSA
jgi:acyl-CoA synthetase (AMP-forming)/AMP-acid ligase II